MMGSHCFGHIGAAAILGGVFFLMVLFGQVASHGDENGVAYLKVDAGGQTKPIPDTLFGIFFEEINHAGVGGLWAELVSNRGFEAGGLSTPSNIDPWTVIGNQQCITVSTDQSSCFARNKIALRMDVHCDSTGTNSFPDDGVGVYNPGYWGMNVEAGKKYNLIMYVRSEEPLSLTMSLQSSNGSRTLASSTILTDGPTAKSWTRIEKQLIPSSTDHFARLSLTTTRKSVIWIDQVSLVPEDTYKGHGFRKDLMNMLLELKPRFIRFPGGCFVEGDWMRNAFRWRETIGPWEERPGHFGDVWHYWSDDGLGYLEYLQLAEDLGALPVWVVNNGISHHDQVATSDIYPFIQDTLDSIEFARGDSKSTWGSVRAEMGHPEPFKLNYIAIGNEDCGKTYYRGNYMEFYKVIKDKYPDIQLISNCDASSKPLDHPADLYDFHIYTSAFGLFGMNHMFDGIPREGPKAFVSEYAVTAEKEAYTFLASLAEAAFLIGLERNSDAVTMASYAPLFVNVNDRYWNPDAIVFNAWQMYGTPSYWMQQFFRDSSGGSLLPAVIYGSSNTTMVASALTWQNEVDKSFHLNIKVVNFNNVWMNLTIAVSGLQANDINPSASYMTVFSSSNLTAVNSFDNPYKVVPIKKHLANAGTNMQVTLSPYSLTAFDLTLIPDIVEVSQPPFARKAHRKIGMEQFSQMQVVESSKLKSVS